MTKTKTTNKKKNGSNNRNYGNRKKWKLFLMTTKPVKRKTKKKKHAENDFKNLCVFVCVEICMQFLFIKQIFLYCPTRISDK